MRSAVFGAGAVVVIAVATVAAGAADPARRASEINNLSSASPCAPGAGYSAAACESAQADPDAPIATARYFGDPVTAAPPEPSVQMAMLTEPPRHSRTFQPQLDPARTTPVAQPPSTRVAAMVQPLTAAWREPAGGSPRVGDLTGRIARDTTRQSDPVQRLAQSNVVRSGIGELKDFGQRARVFLFAGNGSRMLAYNFTRDDGAVQGGGWSMERATKIGDTQIGLAWQSNRTRVALVGMERKFTQFFGASMKDQLVAVRLSFFPGKRANAPES